MIASTSTFALSDRGSLRCSNQDAYLCLPKLGLFAVADGLGGLPNGERASRLTLDLLASHYQRAKAQESLADTLVAINTAVREVGFQLSPEGFGSTVTSMRLLRDGKAELAHVGDSAAFLSRKGCLQLLTAEHTVAARMCAEVWAAAEEAIPLQAYHTLTQCMGQFPYIEPQIMTLSVQAGDRYFLVTDGVTKPLAAERLKQQLLRNDSLERICQNLTFMIEAADSPDNYTIVAFEV